MNNKIIDTHTRERGSKHLNNLSEEHQIIINKIGKVFSIYSLNLFSLKIKLWSARFPKDKTISQTFWLFLTFLATSFLFFLSVNTMFSLTKVNILELVLLLFAKCFK